MSVGKTGLALVVTVALGSGAVTGCARLGAEQPSASPALTSAGTEENLSGLAGEWTGVVTGSEFGSAEGQKAETVWLQNHPDQT